MLQYKITVMSDPEVPEPVIVDVTEGASGPFFHDLGKAVAEVLEARTGLAIIEIEQVA